MDVFTVTKGDSPVILAQPHGGTHVPEAIFSRLNARGQGLDDTDWHITRLYDGLLDNATVVASIIHRYVIDANRDPSGVSLYPGQFTTTLCPTTDFDGHDIWREGEAPGADEIEERREAFHAPYHAALAEEVARVQALHGCVILYDCHSIRSDIPALFEGRLPIFNIGTNMGETCDESVETGVVEACPQESRVVNGRFKGGWTTRHYGAPAKGQHAIQMELAQRCYMEEAAPWAYAQTRAAETRLTLKRILDELNCLGQSGRLKE